MTKEDKIIDDYFNKNIEYDKREVYQAIVNRVADLEFENEKLKKKEDTAELTSVSIAYTIL